MERFVFRYEITEEHLRPAARWILWHRYGRAFWIRMVAFAGMSTLAVFMWREEGITSLTVFCITVAIGLLLALVLFHPRGMKALMKTKLMGMEQVVTIDREGVEVTGPGFQSRSDCGLLWQVVALDHGLIVQPSPGAYWWLPFDRVEGEFRKEDLGALLASLPVQVRG